MAVFADSFFVWSPAWKLPPYLLAAGDRATLHGLNKVGLQRHGFSQTTLSNLKKAYPYIPDALNRILMHFAHGSNWYYEYTHQMIDDLQGAMSEMGRS